MAHDVFISYSVKDATAAQMICAALESNGIPCWIGPRDVPAGGNYADSITQAIRQSKAMLLVFSEHADASVHVTREVDAAVNLRMPLIPVRIADVAPGDAMKYFLSLTQWLDAFDHPLDHYKDQIVTNTRNVLKGRRMALITRPFWMRWWKVAAGAAAVVAVAVLTAHLMAFKPDLETTSRLSGRWKLEGGSCVFDVGSGSATVAQFSFSDGCSGRLLGASGTINMVPNGMMAPRAYQQGDDGTFMMTGNGTGGITGSFRRSSGFFGLGGTSLALKADGLPAGMWRLISNDAPLQDESDKILPAHVDWPIKNVPQMIQTATVYMRKKWQPDAVPMRFSAELQRSANSVVTNAHADEGGVQVTFVFFSPTAVQTAFLMPHSLGGALTLAEGGTQNVSYAIRGPILDLPVAVARLGNPRISKAELEWSDGPACGTGNFLKDNAILPPCGNRKKVVGVQWQIDTLQNGRYWVANSGR
jgi:hypothetical protein